MAWNGSSSAGASTPAPKNPAKKSPGLTHGLIAGGAIVLIGVISLYFVTSETDEPTVEKKAPTQIAEVEADLSERPKTDSAAPAVAGVASVEKQKGFKSKYSSQVFKTEEEMKKWEAENVSRPGIRTGKKPMPTINIVESEIHRIVNSKPGDPFLETPLPTKRFDEMMQAALVHKIEPDKDDTPERKEQIKRIEEAKAFLRQELKGGKDLRTILVESKAELRRAADNVKFMQDEIKRAARENGATLTDMQDMESAANKILADNGIDAKVKMSGRDRVRLQVEAEESWQSNQGEESNVTEGDEE